MRCTEAAHQLQLYIDRRLTLKQTRALESHVAHCVFCQEELALLEEIASGVRGLKLISEPADLTTKIMQRVATTPSRRRTPQFSLLRLSLPELLAAVLLATVATLGSVLAQPSLRTTLLTFTGGHDLFSSTFATVVHLFATTNVDTLIGACWVIGTILGIFITLALAGNEMRTQWLKAMIERLPVR